MFPPAGCQATRLIGRLATKFLSGRVFPAYVTRRYNSFRRSRQVERTRGGVMYFKQFYLGCLAHASYLIGSDGAAAVVDPQRDVDHYIQEAKSQGLRIDYVIETHLHADFVSGHIELAARTGAQIVFGE